MEMKSFNPFTGKLEIVSEEEQLFLEELKTQFDSDVQLLLAEREIVKEILYMHLKS
jgi:hypothetical protein